MPLYLDPTGRQVPASQALIGSVVRDGYRVQVTHGEHVSFDTMLMDRAPLTMLMDGKTAEAPTSIDETFRALVAEAAKRSGTKPSEYLARLSRQDVEKLAEQAATTFVGSAGAAGVAGAFQMDRAAEGLDRLVNRSLGAFALADAKAGRSRELVDAEDALATQREERKSEMRNAWRR